MTRRSTSSSSHGKPASSHASLRSARPERSKRADTSASASPDFTAVGSALSPSARRTASTRIDFPAPVSPVTMFRPGANGTRTSRKMARLRTESSISMWGKESPLSPLELCPKNGEDVLEGGAEEAERRVRLLPLDPVIRPDPESHLPVQREEDVGLPGPQLHPDLHVVGDDDRPVRKGVRTDRGDDDGAQRRIENRPLRGEGVHRRSGGSGGDQPARLERREEHPLHRGP